jgi:hypothetical protein
MLHFGQFVHLSDTELAAQDIAVVNLTCAAGLPGAEHVDIGRCLAVLDGWAAHVGRETDRCAGQFQRDPAAFGNSWGYFRTLMLVTVLHQDLGVYYNPERMRDPDGEGFFRDAGDVFIHGVLTGRGGTCASIPVVCAAVGRRLGYPLKLVSAAGHLFARWEEAGGERFNVECSNRGLNCYPDDYYRTWPYPLGSEEVEAGGFLKSQTPREELAGFVGMRGNCWLDHDQYGKAARAYAWASTLAPGNCLAVRMVETTLGRWGERLRPLVPPGMPSTVIQFPPRQFPTIPAALERHLVHLEILEALLAHPAYDREWWEPLRRQPGHWPHGLPGRLAVRCSVASADFDPDGPR